MLGNTIVLPLSSGNITAVKINQDAYSSEYLFRDGTHQFVVRIRHSVVNATKTYPAYERHNLEVVQTVFAAGGVAEFYRKFYFVIEQLPSDTSVVLADGVADLVIASSNALVVSLLGKES